MSLYVSPRSQERGAGQVAETSRPPITVILSGILLGIALFSYIQSDPALQHLRWVALGAVAVGIPPILVKAWAAVRSATLNINALMVIAVAGAIGLEDYVEAAGGWVGGDGTGDACAWHQRYPARRAGRAGRVVSV
jgi:Cd2+/Zn2+-exporting ATPase